MKSHRSKEVRQLPLQTRVLHALSEFDSAKTPSERMAALSKLQPLIAGNGARNAALRKCLALIRRVERLEAWQIRTGRNLPISF